MLYTDLPGNLTGFETIRGRQAGRDSRHGYGMIAKNFVGYFEDQTAVGTARKSHYDTAQPGQDFLELLNLFVLHFNFLRVLDYQ